MRTLLATTPDLWKTALETAEDILVAGGVVIYPTDTIYGLGANALNTRAVERIFEIKGRSNEKSLPVAIGAISWAKELAYVSPQQEKILRAVWPGKVSVVLAARSRFPAGITSEGVGTDAGLRTVCLRIPDHPFITQLLKQYGYPITATSANISGQPGSGDPVVITRQFLERRRATKNAPIPDACIDIGVLPPSEPSTILDLSGDKPRILRVGATTPAHLLDLLKI